MNIIIKVIQFTLENEWPQMLPQLLCDMMANVDMRHFLFEYKYVATESKKH